MPNTKRAIQFMPFNGLRGYENLVNQAEHPRLTKREITEAHAAILNHKLHSLCKGETIIATYYTEKGYRTTICCVKEVDSIFHILRSDKGNIPFSDLWDIETGF